jgi:hypothetical protein
MIASLVIAGCLSFPGLCWAIGNAITLPPRV